MTLKRLVSTWFLIRMAIKKIEYDKYGFMKYNPDFHSKQYEPWSWEEDLYLMKYYKYDGLESISMGLERKPSTVYGRVQTLRKWGFKF